MKFQLTHSDILASRRHKLGMTIKDVSDISRVDYNKIQDLERKKYKRIDAPILEAVCYALGLHPVQVSENYEPPSIPRLAYVGVDGQRVAGHLKAQDINAVEFARRAGVDQNLIYGITRYDQQTIPAVAARKIAKAMGLQGYELAPALGIWPGLEGEEMYGDLLGSYGGETPEDVSPLPE